MKFWKEHEKLRIVIMVVTFVLGLVLLFAGWKMTGSIVGLGIMIVGVIFLLTTLLVYNKPFEDPKKKF